MFSPAIKPPLQVKLFGPMTKPGDDPRIRKPTPSPRQLSHYGFTYMAKATAAMNEEFEQSDLDEAMCKAADAAEQVYTRMTWTLRCGAFPSARSATPSPLSCSPALLPSSTLYTLTITITLILTHLRPCARR